MSTFPPPDNQPYNDVLPPPPPPRSSSDGCWKWGAVGCGMGCLSLALLFGAIIMFAVMPLLNTCMKLESDLNVLHQEMRSVSQAVNKYQDQKGAYPPNLNTLVPTYISADSLKWSQNPSGPVFKYTRPTGDDSGETALLEYAMPYKLSDGRTAPILIRLLQSGDFAPEDLPEQCRQLSQSQGGFRP